MSVLSLTRFLCHCYLISVLLLLGGCAASDSTPAQLVVQQSAEVEPISTAHPDSSITQRLKKLNAVEISDYRIAAGDKFNVFVYGEDDLETKGVIVKNDGTISFKLIGDIKVAGLTMKQATALMEKKLAKYIIHPKVSLLPYEMRSASITIIGKVANPGVYYFDGELRVVESIGRAGGLSVGIFDNNTIELADLEHSYIMRDKELLPVNLARLVHNGDMRQNIPLLHGDYIYIASAMSKEVFIVGEVNKPGYFGYTEQLTLGRLVSKAEGVRVTANKNAVVVRGNIKNPLVYRINIEKILTGQTRDFPIEPSDIVYIPKNTIGQWNAWLTTILPSLETLITAHLLDNAIYNTRHR